MPSSTTSELMTSLPSEPSHRPSTLRRLRRRTRPWRRGPRRATARAVGWALEEVSQLQSHTHAGRLVGLVEPPLGRFPPFAGTDVRDALERSTATCLQRCLVLQAWLIAHDQPCDVVIGVRTAGGFGAHAWIPGIHDAAEHDGFREMARVPPFTGGSHAITPTNR